MRIAIYARKSTENEDRQIQSLADQISELTALAKREHLIVSEIFQEARSAKEPNNRPEFQRLIDAIDEGTIDAILTWSINRLSRNAVDGGMVAHLLQTGKLTFIRTIERTYRPEDNALLLSIENGMAIAYLQDLRRNVMRGMKGKVERGWHTCKAPVGYKNDADSREIVPDSERFALVRRAWDMLLERQMSVSEVHRELVKLGLHVRTKSGRTKPISRAKLHAVFRDRFYLGEINFKGEHYPGRHQPMVSPVEFDIVREMLASRSKRKRPNLRSFHFTGSLRCAVCGCAIVAEQREKHYPKTGRTATYVYYHCSGSRGCRKSGVRQEILQEQIEKNLLGRHLTPETANWLKDALLESVEKDSCLAAGDIAALEHEQANLDARLRELTYMRSGGEITPSEYLSIRTEIQNKLIAIREKLAFARTAATRILHLIYQRIDAAVTASGLSSEDYNTKTLGDVLNASGAHALNLESFEIRLDPVFEKITAFEPVRNGYDGPKRGDVLPLDSVWWRLVDDLRTTATDQIARYDFLDAQRSPMGRREEHRRSPRGTP